MSNPAMADMLAALERCDRYVTGCGDSMCYFAKPTGMHTNGGCRCLDGRGHKPFEIHALAELLKACRAMRDEMNGEKEQGR